MKGEGCAFVGPWFHRSRRAFDETKKMLEPWIRTRHVRANESRLQLTSTNGGYIDFLSADNPDCLFGGNYYRLVLDESSRMPAEIYPAALTVISATDGKLRLFFNLELGVRNWSIRNLLRVQKLSAEERQVTEEDFMTFGTDAALVDPQLVQTLKKQMPIQLWEALYEGKIPTSDCSLFRNLDRVFAGRERDEPLENMRYIMGLDLARKSDWTVATVIDENGNVVACDRFSQVSWSLQIERVALLYRTFRCSKVVADATGVGDALIEQLEAQGLEVEPFVFTQPSRRQLIESLVVSCDNCEIRIPNTEKFHVYRQELESFEFQVDGTQVRYAAPTNQNDDCVMSLGLAIHGWRKNRGALLGVVLLVERYAREIAEGTRDAWGELIHPKPKPVTLKPRIAAVPKDPKEEWRKRWQRNHEDRPPCPAHGCGSKATTYNGAQIHCNQCGAEDGVIKRVIVDGGCPDCGKAMRPIANGWYCQNDGFKPSAEALPRGATFRDLKR